MLFAFEIDRANINISNEFVAIYHAIIVKGYSKSSNTKMYEIVYVYCSKMSSIAFSHFILLLVQ